MPEAAVQRVLVVGGGIAGGVLSLGLAQKGVEVVLVDLRDGLGGVGHGITLQGNALKAFQAVGIYDRLAERGFAFSHLRMKSPDGHVIMEIPTPPMGGPDLPGTMGALRGDLADILADEVVKAGVDVRLGTTVTHIEDHGDSVTRRCPTAPPRPSTWSSAPTASAPRCAAMIGIEDQPKPVGMGIWRTVAKRPAEMDCSELYFGGPKYKAGYTPISEDLCYAFLLEENLDRSFVGEGARGAELKERGQGYGGIWGQVRDSLADDAIVNYQWIEAICVDSPWFRGRTIIIGDAAHACPPLIAQGAAMCAEDAVILAEMLTSGSSVDEVLPAFMERRFPRVKMVLDNSLTLAEWEIHPETPGADPGRIMGQTLGALVAPA